MSDFPSDETLSGGPTPTGTASNTWPNFQPGPLPPPAEAYRHCPTCTCSRHQYVPYIPQYPQQPWIPLWTVY